MNRAEQIRDRQQQIGDRLQELATEFQKSETVISRDADFDEIIQHLPFTREGRAKREKERQMLIDERRQLEREFERLPDAAKDML